MVGVCTIKIQETPAQLRHLLNQQEDVNSFKKIQALYLFKTHQVQTVKDVAVSLGVHRVTVQKWFKKYREQGIDGLLMKRKSTGRPSVIPDVALSKLEERLQQSTTGFKSYEEVHGWLKEQYGINADYKTVYGIVKYKLNTNLNEIKKEA